MKKIILMSMLLVLSACVTTKKDIKKPDINIDVELGQGIGKAPAAEMPELPATLAQKAGPLPPVTDGTLAGLQQEAAATDRAYNEVGHRLNNVIDAWNCVRVSLRDRKNPKECFGG